MCKLTTSHGITWEITRINDRAAFQYSHYLVCWMPSLQSYILLNGMAQKVMVGTSHDCLEYVRPIIPLATVVN